ncbi:AraC family transcriptional regulator [Neolewinella lacunae]|uniref:Helix-turn-helix transcriptional regulator n=1 Tax=Neolewinella lacunae TaxID=1517758 RepID=A0A923T924_9BACT|nr:AraC family transcriptional regulator [Neolewinella lacunae]MBC6995126.1 helix-turn-helix transcriptional regulator [Neolewinella lacunae]MDN3634076.1 AraC family transcriptional regulator [Neolewinella lacunae]
MDFTISFQTAALLFFFVQGLLFAGLLLARGQEYAHRPSRWLSLFLLLCSLYLVPFMLGYSGWYGRDGYREFLFFVPFQHFFLIGPVIYCYTRSLLDADFRIRGRSWLHFLPGGLYLLYSLVVFVVDVWVLQGDYYFYADGRDKDLAPWYQITGLLAMIAYTGLSLRAYQQYRKRIFAELSYADSVVYSWVKQYLVALLFIMVLRIVFLLLLPNFGSFGRWFWYYLCFGALYYFIALAGYTNVVKALAPLHWRGESKLLSSEIPAPKSTAETLEDEDLEPWKQRVRDLMEREKLYENPTLTLSDVAGRLGVTSKQVSGIINQGFRQNFNDFVNTYRVAAVRERFARGEHERFTILSIALACGFNSKTTFNRVFKQFMARTPVQYLADRSKGSSTTS